MTKRGKVIKATKDFAVVAIVRESACGGNCKSCNVCAQVKNYVTVKNTKNVRVGDVVNLYADSKKIIFASFLVYILPILLIFTACFIGNLCFKSELAIAATILFSIVLWTVIVKLFGKKKIENEISEVIFSGD